MLSFYTIEHLRQLLYNKNPASTDGFANFNPRRKKKSSYNCENGSVRMLQQFQLIPVVVNRFAPLDNLQEAMEASPNLNKTSKVTLTRN